MESERRRHPRKARRIPFYCYVNGARFDSDSVDISEGGTLLKTEDDIPMDATVLVVPRSNIRRRGHAGEARAGRVVLVGKVVRKHGGDAPGVGVRWVKCVSRDGLDALHTLLSLLLDIFPSSLPLPAPEVAKAPSLAWDFHWRRFHLMDVQRKPCPRPSPRRPTVTLPPVLRQKKPVPEPEPLPEPPPAPELELDLEPAPELERASLLTPELEPEPEPSLPVQTPLSRDDTTGPVTHEVTSGGDRIPVRVPVEFYMGESVNCGTVVRLAGTVCTLQIEDPSPEEAEKMVVSFPLYYKKERHVLYLACGVGGKEELPEGGVLLDLSIKQVDNEPVEGLFLRYVKYLYFSHVVS